MTRTTIIHGGSRPDHHARDPDHHDTAGAAEARVSLKLAAERYNASRYGADAGGRLTAAALFTLRSRALYYYSQVNRIDLQKRLPADLRELHEYPLVDQTYACLQNAAMAYSNTRGGADASLEFTRAAIADLCTAAVAYAEALLEVVVEDAAGPREPRKREHGDVIIQVLGEETHRD